MLDRTLANCHRMPVFRPPSAQKDERDRHWQASYCDRRHRQPSPRMRASPADPFTQDNHQQHKGKLEPHQPRQPKPMHNRLGQHVRLTPADTEYHPCEHHIQRREEDQPSILVGIQNLRICRSKRHGMPRKTAGLDHPQCSANCSPTAGSTVAGRSHSVRSNCSASVNRLAMRGSSQNNMRNRSGQLHWRLRCRRTI